MNDISELQAIDFGLGRYIIEAFDGLAAVGPADYKEFIARATNKQIFRHDFDEPQDFISSYVGGRKGSRTVDANTTANTLDLPLVAFCRKPGITNNDDRGGIINDKLVWATEAQEEALKMTVLPIGLTYKIIMLAWDKPTLDKLQLAWYAHVSRRPAKSRFEVIYKIADSLLPVRAYIQDTKSIDTMDISLPKADGRVFGVELTLNINSQVLFGESVEVGDAEIHFNLVGYCGLEVPCCG